MNQKVADMGMQVKQAFQKVVENWKSKEPARKKRILIIAGGLVAIALGLVLILNMLSGRYVVIFEDMSLDESVRSVAVLQAANISARINKNSQLEVPSNRVNQAMGQLAMHGLPSSGFTYGEFDKAAGLTTTDFEKRQHQINQLQNRMQDIIRTYPGVQNAYVTLNMGNDSNRVWDAGRTTNTGSVKVDLVPGNVLTPAQVQGIQYLVGSGTGIEPSEISVVDTFGTPLVTGGEGGSSAGNAAEQFQQQLGFEAAMEDALKVKATYILSGMYPDANNVRIVPRVILDWDKLVQEAKTYFPLEGTNHGVIEQSQDQAIMGMGQFEGVVGEDPNTDIPTYADLNGDGEPDMIDYNRLRQYLVSYDLQQRERVGAAIQEATIAVYIDDTLTDQTRQAIRELVSAATNISIENVTVHGIATGNDDGGGTTPPGPGDNNTILGIPMLYLYIAAGALVLIILLLILMLVLRGKSKKKKLALALQEQEAELAEQERIQQEIEERKRQLKDAAIGDQSENAITNEVRDFARANPEITATLLRTWLKDGES